MTKLFESREVCAILGIKSRRLLNWVEREFIVPAQAGGGSGIRRGYSFKNLVQIKLLIEVNSLGINLTECKHISRQAFRNKKHPAGRCSFYPEGSVGTVLSICLPTIANEIKLKMEGGSRDNS